jgi:hypothetical protein
MFFVGPEGETLDVDGSVVGKEKDMRENPRTRKGIEETRDKISKQQKLDSDKEKQFRTILKTYHIANCNLATSMRRVASLKQFFADGTLPAKVTVSYQKVTF